MILQRLKNWWGRLFERQIDGERYFSPLMLRILAVNVLALAILVASVLYLGRYQDRLIASELEALRLQARLSASAIGEGAVVIDEEERNILSPLLARLMIRRLVEATETRTRLFDLDNNLLADSQIMLGHAGPVEVEDLPSSSKHHFWLSNMAMAVFDGVDRLVEQRHFPTYADDESQRAEQIEVLNKALVGEPASQVWSLPEGGLMLAVAVPVQRYKQVLGTVMLSRPDINIDVATREVRLNILRIFTITLLITIMLSLYLARAIAQPIRQLAQAAEGVRHGQMEIVGLAGTASLLGRDTIPDLTARHDEIGDLSAALRDMTSALATRIGAIENFAADVSHEIKNPLTSLRSAVETAERVQDPAMQRRLMVVIRDDVDRLDRLISDISSASRLDAELSRASAEPIALGPMLTTLVDFYNVSGETNESGARVVCPPLEDGLMIRGVEVRLVQVLQNLIANALSFAPAGSEVVLSAVRDDKTIRVTVSDSGTGIPENKLDAIFDRFYSERPKAEKFGMHSGLGLSISKQIVEAHRGRIWAGNRRDEKGEIIGAEFVVELPAA